MARLTWRRSSRSFLFDFTVADWNACFKQQVIRDRERIVYEIETMNTNRGGGAPKATFFCGGGPGSAFTTFLGGGGPIFLAGVLMV